MPNPATHLLPLPGSLGIEHCKLRMCNVWRTAGLDYLLPVSSTLPALAARQPRHRIRLAALGLSPWRRGTLVGCAVPLSVPGCPWGPTPLPNGLPACCVGPVAGAVTAVASRAALRLWIGGLGSAMLPSA